MLETVRAAVARNDEGSNATEYVLLLALIAALIIGAVVMFGGFLEDAFEGTCDKISTESAIDATCTTSDSDG